MLLAILTLIVHVLACDPDENDAVSGINPGCNYAGTCITTSTFVTLCECCEPDTQESDNRCGEYWSCNPHNPSHECVRYSGSTCTEVEMKLWLWFTFSAGDIDTNAPSDVVCQTDPYEKYVLNIWKSATIDFVAQVQYVATQYGWPGTVLSAWACDTCSPAYPCTWGVPYDLNVTQGSIYHFQINFSEYYHPSCAAEAVISDASQIPECPYNYDFGQSAYLHWTTVRGDDTSFLDAVNDILQAAPDDSNDNLGLGWTNTVMLSMGERVPRTTMYDVVITLSPSQSPTESPTEMPTASPTSSPTQIPTGSPTTNPTALPTTTPSEAPTSSPTTTPSQTPTLTPTSTPSMSPTGSPTMQTSECGPYINQVEDLVFQGVGANCRAGLNASWPGELSCDSPYIVCLPRENTVGEFGGESYKNTTYRYSVDECLQECANDQRCLGAEFVADSSSTLGDCNLIDDIPIEIDSMVTGFVYDSDTTYSTLDSAVTNGKAMCFSKQSACNPYFEAEDLSPVMLNCYCPNNRKGYYTKKVKRTVANTRFCGNNSEVDRRIQKAQANRMFHLCENWCLFLTDDPEAESWYWDPWKSCFREQYAGVGVHMSYCSRVIRNPDTIEMQYLNHRSTVCQKEIPTESPSLLDSNWYMAIEEASCDDVCDSVGLVCDENLVASVVDQTSQSEMLFTEAGVSCASISIGEEGWALPGYKISDQSCLVRNSATEKTPCNWAIGVGYQRLCACA